MLRDHFSPQQIAGNLSSMFPKLDLRQFINSVALGLRNRPAQFIVLGVG